jgi:hypothetical protein
MGEKHIADAEAIWRVINTEPDMCIVSGQVVPFDIYQVLTPEKSNYSPNVRARGGNKVLHVNSVIKGVIGNAGSGVHSGVSLGSGNTIITQGAQSVRVNGELCARHLDQCWMNAS